jgi:hypothetical protein
MHETAGFILGPLMLANVVRAPKIVDDVRGAA